MMLLVINSIFHLPGAVHQPARGAALLLRPQAAPSPCSRRSEVASIQVKFAFCIFENADASYPPQLPPWLEVGREKRGVDSDEVFASRQRHPDPLP